MSTPGASPWSSVPRTGFPWPAWAAWSTDVALIILFAALGRRTHASGLDAAGILWTALPFLLAWVVATVVTRRNWSGLWPAGVAVWVTTVAGGLAVRVLLGDGAAFSFQLVTAGVLGSFLLGRRLVTTLLMRRRQQPRT